MIYVFDEFNEKLVDDIRDYGSFLQSQGLELMFDSDLDWILTAALSDFRKYLFDRAINNGYKSVKEDI